jgi:hypothetical protein
VNLLKINSILVDLEDEPTTDQFKSSLVNDQSHKIQLEALSRLILRLVNQETGGFGPLVSSH